jgi:hypothetical protein
LASTLAVSVAPAGVNRRHPGRVRAPVALAPARYIFVVCQPAHFSIIDLLLPTLVRLAAGRGEERLVLPRGGVIITANLRDATGWDALVIEFGQPA